MYLIIISQQGEGEHKKWSKQFYPRVRKGDHVSGIAQHVYRERTLFQVQQAMENQLLDPEQIQHVEENTLKIPLSEEEALGPTLPEHHHHMSKETRHKVDCPEVVG